MAPCTRRLRAASETRKRDLAREKSVDFYRLVVGILVVWRITHLLFAEDGPWDAIIWLRRQAGTGFWGKLLDCFYCLSLWIAAPLAMLLGSGWEGRLLLWPALSAGAILLERLTSRDET